MALVITDVGGSNILDIILGGATADTDYFVRLFTNTRGTLTDTAIEVDFVQPVNGGYQDISFNVGDISPAALSNPGDVPYVLISPAVWTGGGQVGNQAGALVWKFTGATTLPIVGYDIVGVQSGFTYWFEELPSDYQPTTNGDELRLTPKFMLGKATAEDLATITA